ncbi:YybH family protein [Thioclava pacifica]|uniref:DUF4440 domain-containing protein n=1 Tax=Thioclava pacifica DSM 10166 TaxID=1353537 RepID=A0A074JHJ9_9RHOB|nr:SgcJ/EcaC family oxidoreductase [Thioclava pacifica]KEO55385.1 hypothetical protein TP2_15200 [Thioclava pacifica DSM 10166]
MTKMIMVGLVCAALCGGTVSRADDASDVEAAIGTWQALWNAGDARAAAQAIFTEDAVLLPPDGPMLTGRDAITAFWQPILDSPAHSLELELLHLDLLGDTAIETGTWAVSVPGDDGKDKQIGGKTLVVWKKGADGQWRMAQDMWNNGN